MTDSSDALARLGAANPVPAARVALLDPDPVLFRRIVAGGGDAAVPRRHPRRRSARRLVPAFIVASLVGGAVGYAVLRDEVTKPATAACYERADLTAAIEVAAVGDEGPLAACADMWRRGAFGAGAEVPPLTQCTLESGVVAVFPATAGADTCAGLYLPPAPSSTTAPAPDADPPPDVNARVLAFRDATQPQFVTATCVTPAAGVDIVRRELGRAGLTGWTVTAEGFTAERPCATLSIRADARSVILVPAPPRR